MHPEADGNFPDDFEKIGAVDPEPPIEGGGGAAGDAWMAPPLWLRCSSYRGAECGMGA